MTRASKIFLISFTTVIIIASIGGWTWILKDKERARIEAEAAAVSQAAAEAAKLAEAPASEPESEPYSIPPIKLEPKTSVSSAAGIEPIESKPAGEDGQNTGDASRPEVEPPPPESAVSSEAPKEEKPASSQTSSTPKDGDRKTVDGKAYVYIKGFGWKPITGSESIYAPDMKENGNKIGKMG